jgi:hypothetical protein
VQAGGSASNSTLSALHKSMGSAEQGWYDTGLAVFQSGTEVAAGLSFLAVTMSLSGKNPQFLYSQAPAWALLVFGFLSAMVIGFIIVTSITNYQEAHAVAIGLAAGSMAFALFGAIFNTLVMLRGSAANLLNSNLKLIASIGYLFVLFDLAAGASVLSAT